MKTLKRSEISSQDFPKKSGKLLDNRKSITSSVSTARFFKGENKSSISTWSKLPSVSLLTKDKQVINEMKEYLPEWLILREDFNKLYLKMQSKHELNIGDICSIPALSRSEDEKEALFMWLTSKIFFSKMPRMLVRETCEKLCTVKCQKGERIIKKGDEGDCMYIVYSGTVGIYVDSHKVGTRVAGEVLGETALDTDKPRSADAIAEESLVLLRLKKIDYISILKNLKKLEKYESSRFLMDSEIFSKWSIARMQVLGDYLVSSRYKSGEIIYEIGSESTAIYIITAGSVSFHKFAQVTKHNKWPVGLKKWEVQKVTHKFLISITKRNTGEVFGIETINNSLRITRATADCDTSCLVLNKNECFELFARSDLQKLMKYEIKLPQNEEIEDNIRKNSVSKTQRENILLDALKTNFKDWGGRETFVEKNMRRRNRCISNLRLHHKKHENLTPIECRTLRENLE